MKDIVWVKYELGENVDPRACQGGKMRLVCQSLGQQTSDTDELFETHLGEPSSSVSAGLAESWRDLTRSACSVILLQLHYLSFGRDQL